MSSDTNISKLRVMVSGGGTGGHIFPAIAIAQALDQVVPEVEFLFVGAKGRMEMVKVPAAGYKIEGLWISGLQRKLTLKNLSFPFKVLSSVMRSHKLIKNFKPDVVIGVGGFASGPLLFAAASRGIPCLIHEQNSYAGITNKLLGPKVKTICVAYDNMERYFPAGKKIVKTGNPVRKHILDTANQKAAGYEHFGLDPNKKTLLVIGGSLGARTINQSMEAGLEKISASGIQLLWQTGKSHFDQEQKKATDSIKIKDFIFEMDKAYGVADIVISRAGAISIAELAMVGKPVILVPSPNVAEDHQTKNAMALVEKGAAILVKDVDAKNNLVDQALQLMQDETKQKDLQQGIKDFALPDAPERIAKEVLALVEE